MNNSKKSIEALIAASQDGKSIDTSTYGVFLQNLIDENSHGEQNPFVDADELADNIRYAISEFKKALNAIQPIAQRVREIKDRPTYTGPMHTLTQSELNVFFGFNQI